MDVVDLHGDVIGSGSQVSVINSKFSLSPDRKRRFDVSEALFVSKLRFLFILYRLFQCSGEAGTNEFLSWAAPFIISVFLALPNK